MRALAEIVLRNTYVAGGESGYDEYARTHVFVDAFFLSRSLRTKSRGDIERRAFRIVFENRFLSITVKDNRARAITTIRRKCLGE